MFFVTLQMYKESMVMNDLKLEKQYDFYVSHEQELLSKYNGKYLVISDTMQVIPFEAGKEAYTFATRTFGKGKFLLHQCVPGSLNVIHSVNCYIPNA